MSRDNRPAQPSARRREISTADYRELAEFRFQIRQFLHFTEEAARAHGMEPQQHQLLLAIKGLPKGARPTVTTISDRLCLRHHSTVELIDRLEKQGAVARQHGKEDRREVLLHLTPRGEERLRRLTVSIWPQLQVEGMALSGSLQKLLTASREPGKDIR